MELKSLIILKCFSILIIYFNPFVGGDIPYGLCANPTCSVPVSIGVTILQYSSPDDNRISVEPNEAVEIFVKDYGPKKDLWGVIVRGNKGYISKQFIREMRAYTKNLVPAEVEFKTSLMVTTSGINANPPHFSSHHQPDLLAHTHVVQQDVISPIPSGVQSQWNKPAENLQASHISSQFNPNHNMQLDSLSGFDVSDESSKFALDYDEFLSSSYMVDLKTGNILPSPFYGLNSELNPVQEEQFQTSFPQSGLNSELNIQPNTFQLQHTKHFHSDSVDPGEGFQSSSLPQSNFQSAPSLQQQNLPPVSNVHQQNFQPSSNIHRQNFPSPSNVHQLNLQHASKQPSIKHPENHENIRLFPSQQSVHSSPSMRQSQFHSSPVQEMSSFSSDYEYDKLFEEEFSKTMALLEKRKSTLYSSSEPGSDLHQSSQNINPQSDSHEEEFIAALSQSQSSIVQNTDASFQPSPSLNPTVTQNSQIFPSEVPIIKEDIVVPHEEQSENIGKDAVVLEKTDEEIKTNMNNVNSGINDEEEDDDGEMDEDEEEEYSHLLNSDSEDDSKPVVVPEETVQYTEPIAVITKTVQSSEPVVESSMISSSISEEASKFQFTQSLELDSSISDEGTKDQPSLFSKEPVTFSSKDHLSSSEEIQNSANFQESNMPDLKIQTNIVEGLEDRSGEANLNITHSQNVINATVIDLNKFSTEVTKNKDTETIKDNFLEKEMFLEVPERNNNDALQGGNVLFKEKQSNINEFFGENEQISVLNNFVNDLDVDRNEDLKNTYQVRNLKGESMTTEKTQSDTDGGQDENITTSDDDIYSTFENGWDALKSIIDSVMSWLPEPLYSAVMGLQEKGISPRVPVFTVICGFTLIFLIVPLIYIREYSKESKLAAQLASVEKDAYTFSATNALLEEKLEMLQAERKSLQACIEKEKSNSEKLKSEFEKQAEELENIKAQLESSEDEFEALKKKEDEYLIFLNECEKEKGDWIEQKNSFEKVIKEHSESIANLTDQLQESDRNIEDLQKEKMQYEKLKEDYEEKLSHFEINCNQLLQEAEVWNLRVNELTAKVSEERTLKEEVEAASKEKDEEIESLKELVETFKAFEEIEDPEEQEKTKEEKLQTLMNSARISSQLKKQEDETKVFAELLEKEKSKILDMEVELLEAKSEIDKLKISYNQALQDKAEAQTKLDVLTNYFKDKEIQLQKQLGAQEAVRQKKEEDASSAERRVVLIEQENASYKYQVASMKQEMEETERNLKSQIAVQEKKAHENWIAARAAERKLEDMKQEVTQLRQRLTLLEREQENWANASRDEIIRPVPKRVPGMNDESGSQDLNTSERGMFPPPMMPPPPMMLPPDRPLPPLPPPHMFMPPMERHFRPQPWHLPPPDAVPDFRSTPPEFIPGRESTPPRRRPFDISDGDVGPHASSPLTTDTRDSRNSTPPHMLPDFHDVPPQPGRPPFYPHPPLGPRLPMHPPFRRDMGPGPKRLDNSNEYNSRGPQQPPPSQEQWQHSRV